MKKGLPVLIIALILFQSCLNGQIKNGIYKNDQIDSKIRSAINANNKMAFAAISEGKLDGLDGIIWDSLKMNLNDDFKNKFIPQMSRIMKGKTYRVFADIYIQTAKAQDSCKIEAGDGDNKWSMKISTRTKESYLSMLVTGDTLNEVMLTLVYEKIDGKWKLCNIMGEDYSLAGKNALDLYHHAQELEKKNYLIDAINFMSLSNHCLHPAGQYFLYAKQKEIKDYTDSLTNKTIAIFPFPYLMQQVKSMPTVVNLHYEVYEHQFVPFIAYQSHYFVKDTVALKGENDEIQSKIGTIFPGMDKIHPYILYRVYNDLPQGNSNPPYYGFIQKIKSELEKN